MEKHEQAKIKEYIKLRMKLAQDKIRVAEILLVNREYRDAVSRAYYAVYYAAKAFLLSHGEDPSSHKGVDILFHRFSKTLGEPSIDTAKMLSLMQKARLEADYREKVKVTQENAKGAIEMAKSFLREIKNLLK